MKDTIAKRVNPLKDMIGKHLRNVFKSIGKDVGKHLVGRARSAIKDRVPEAGHSLVDLAVDAGMRRMDK